MIRSTVFMCANLHCCKRYSTIHLKPRVFHGGICDIRQRPVALQNVLGDRAAATSEQLERLVKEIRAATLNAATLLDVDRGRSAPGDVADITLLGADIESDGRPYRDPIAVIKGGSLVYRRS